MKEITETYKKLLKRYGKQGWWPLLDIEGCNPTKTGSVKGYHPSDYSYPKNDGQRFEICIGAILTQNTSWPNVEKALLNLKKLKAIDAKKILSLNENILKEAIRPSGYFNQKAKKLKIFCEFYIDLKGKVPTREQLLELWGIGKETADSILLYAYSTPIFVVDTYTRRFFTRLGLIEGKEEYDIIRKMFEDSLPKDFKTYQEYHALIVENAKSHCSVKPNCLCCPLDKTCRNKLT